MQEDSKQMEPKTSSQYIKHINTLVTYGLLTTLRITLTKTQIPTGHISTLITLKNSPLSYK